MFGFNNFAPKLDEYKALYSVEPLWIQQMKRVEAADKQLQTGASLSKPKRNSNGLFSMMGKTAARLHIGAGGGGTRGKAPPTTTHAEPHQPPKRPRNLPAMGTPMSGDDNDAVVDEGETFGDGIGSDDDASENGDEDDGEGEADNIGDWKTPLTPDTDLPDVNDIESFREKKMASVVHQNLFTLLSFLALDACYFGENVQDNGKLYENVFSKFMMVFNDSMVASFYWCENFMAPCLKLNFQCGGRLRFRNFSTAGKSKKDSEAQPSAKDSRKIGL